MKKMINKTHIEGLLYEHDLSIKQSGANSKNPGANYIRGSISVQISDDNVVTNEVMEMEFGKNGKNARYDTLLAVMNAATVVASGKDAAAKIRIDAALECNDWYNQNKDLVSVIRSSGGFIHLVSSVNPSATFEVDMLITSTTDEMEKDSTGTMMPNGNLVINGYIFNFRNEILPVKFSIENAKGVEYFRSLDANTFTKVWGNIVTQSVTNTVVEASAFGEDKVVTYTNTRKKFIITGANVESYEFGEEEVLSVADVQKAIADRNTKLETLKNSKNENTTEAKPVLAKNNDTAKYKF